MSQTLANGIIVPTNPDNFQNLTGDLATMGNSANVLIPVASQAARDGLTKKAGLAVVRNDIAGEPIEICDGTNWFRQVSTIVQANGQFVGSGMAVNAFTTGTSRPFRQSNTFVGATDASGYIVIGYPVTFPNGVTSVAAMNGDAGVARDLIVGIASTSNSAGFVNSTSVFYISVVDHTGAAKANTTVRINWFAEGW